MCVCVFFFFGVCVCVCVCERERESVCVCVCGFHIERKCAAFGFCVISRGTNGEEGREKEKGNSGDGK